MRYTVLVDGEEGAYGVVFPDLPGCVAMGDTIDEALAGAVESARDWVRIVKAEGGRIPTPRAPELLRNDPEVVQALVIGGILASVVLEPVTVPVHADLSLDRAVLEAIDEAAARLGLTRSALVEKMARRGLTEFA